MEKWAILEKMGHTWQSGSNLEKKVTLIKMGYT